MPPKLLLPSLALVCACSMAQSTAPAKFTLELQGRNIGKADYAFQRSSYGYKLTAHYEFNVPVAVSATRQAEFNKYWEELAETTNLDVAQTKQSYSLSPKKDRRSLTFKASAGGQDIHQDFPVQPSTVVLANFDPSGVQVLVNTQISTLGRDSYRCFVPSGTGSMLGCVVTGVAGATGTLDGKPVKLQHWTLALATTTMDIYAAENGDLMQSSVSSQALSYTRVGFHLNATQAVAEPPKEVAEWKVTFPSDGLEVPGTVTAPAEINSPPEVIVLVQGSGVQDRDETVGQNKVFQQLAWGLAQQNIATLRYDRRPLSHPESFAAHPDLDHEVVIDAVSALHYVKAMTTTHQWPFNPYRAFLLGHSLGAQLAPYIVKKCLAEDPKCVAGYILLAGVETPIDQTILRQIQEFGKAQGGSDAQIQESTAKWNAIFADARNPSVPAKKPEISGTTAGYWRDWMARDPAAVMRTLPVPALVLRGEYDRNVAHGDFTQLCQAAVVPRSECREFPELNHLFMRVGNADADEMQPRLIDPEVITTIRRWLSCFSFPDLPCEIGPQSASSPPKLN